MININISLVYKLKKIAYIDDFSYYSQRNYLTLFNYAISNDFLLFYYGPKKGFDGGILYNNKLINIRRIWSSFFFPFQILHRIYVDTIDAIHIRLDLTTFGSVFNILNFVFLLLLLKLINKKTLLELSPVFPNNINYRKVDFEKTFNIKNSFFKNCFIVFFYFFYNIINTFAEIIIVYVKSHKKWLIKYGCTESKINVIPYSCTYRNDFEGIDEDYNYPFFNDKKINILYVGSFSERKCFKNMVLSIKELSNKRNDFRFILVGNFSQSYKYEIFDINKYISDNDLKNNFYYLGWKMGKELQYIFYNSDMVLFPFCTYMNGSSTIPLAKQFNKLILLSNKSILNEQFKSYPYISFDPMCIKHFIDVFEYSIDNLVDYKKRLDNLIDFDDDKIVIPKIIDLYNLLI